MVPEPVWKDSAVVAAIGGFTPAMESDGRQESLVLGLQALSRFHAEAPSRPAAGYDLIAALTGISFMTATSFGQPCPAWWILGSRAVYLDFAGQAIGLDIECLAKQPENADLEGMQAFFKEELVPKITAEIEAGRPVLLAGGFPSFGWGLWGVATRVEAGKIHGHTCWFQYVEQPIGEEFPVLAAYSVKTRDRSKRIPMREILQHARELYQNKGEAGWTTGPRAYELWSDQLGSDAPCSEHGEDHPHCFRQVATFVHDAHMTAARFLDFLNEEIPPVLRRFLPGIVDENRAIARLLKELAGTETPGDILGTKEGKKKFQEILAKARTLEESLAKRYAELAVQKEWDAPPPLQKKGKGSRDRGDRSRAPRGTKGTKDKKDKKDRKDTKEPQAKKKPEQKARSWRKISD